MARTKRNQTRKRSKRGGAPRGSLRRRFMASLPSLPFGRTTAVQAAAAREERVRRFRPREMVGDFVRGTPRYFTQGLSRAGKYLPRIPRFRSNLQKCKDSYANQIVENHVQAYNSQKAQGVSQEILTKLFPNLVGLQEDAEEEAVAKRQEAIAQSLLESKIDLTLYINLWDENKGGTIADAKKRGFTECFGLEKENDDNTTISQFKGLNFGINYTFMRIPNKRIKLGKFTDVITFDTKKPSVVMMLFGSSGSGKLLRQKICWKV